MAKKFSIHEWQANQMKKHLAEQDKISLRANKGYRGDSPMPFRSNPDANDQWSKDQIAQDSAMIKKVVNLKMDSEVGEPVTVVYNPKKNLEDVTISWGNESHTVTFEAGDIIDDHGNEGMDIETMAESDDGRWQFILDVYVGYQFKNTGDYEEWDFDELIIQGHPDNEDHLDPEDRSDYDDDLNRRMDPAIRSDFDDPVMDEQNTLAAAGSGTSFTSGKGMGYMSPKTFNKKRKND